MGLYSSQQYLFAQKDVELVIILISVISYSSSGMDRKERRRKEMAATEKWWSQRLKQYRMKMCETTVALNFL